MERGGGREREGGGGRGRERKASFQIARNINVRLY